MDHLPPVSCWGLRSSFLNSYAPVDFVGMQKPAWVVLSVPPVTDFEAEAEELLCLI